MCKCRVIAGAATPTGPVWAPWVTEAVFPALLLLLPATIPLLVATFAATIPLLAPIPLLAAIIIIVSIAIGTLVTHGLTAR